MHNLPGERQQFPCGGRTICSWGLEKFHLASTDIHSSKDIETWIPTLKIQHSTTFLPHLNNSQQTRLSPLASLPFHSMSFFGGLHFFEKAFNRHPTGSSRPKPPQHGSHSHRSQLREFSQPRQWSSPTVAGSVIFHRKWKGNWTWTKFNTWKRNIIFQTTIFGVQWICVVRLMEESLHHLRCISGISVCRCKYL